MTPTDREREFVYSEKHAPGTAAVKQAPSVLTVARAPLTTRIREDFARALKRASPERQLGGIEPHTLQDILEEAIEPWLRINGYLPE